MATIRPSISTQGTYHGRSEGRARLMSIMAFFCFVSALLLPWVGVLIVSRYRHYALNVALKVAGEPRLFLILTFDLLGLTGALTAYSLAKSLNQRIALGGSDADYLDGIRGQLATFFFIAMFLFLEIFLPR